MKDPAFIYVAAGDTARNPSRSGIQTTVRRLVSELASHDADRVNLAFWNRHAECLHLLPPQFSLGLAAEAIRRSPPLSLAQKLRAFPEWFPGRPDHRIPLHRHPLHASRLAGAWLLLPELLYGPHRAERFIAYARWHGMRVAAIFHDAIAVQYPGFVARELPARHLEYMRTLTKADLILPNSEASAAAWRELVGGNAEPTPLVRTVPLAAEYSGAVRSLEPGTTRDDRVRMLCVSTIEPRKNHTALLDALEILAKRHDGLPLDVDLVGAPHPESKALAARIIELEARHSGQFLWHRTDSSAGLVQRYRECDFTVYPSLVEGFGIPILESLWFARPCLCANFGVMAEHAGGGGCVAIDVRNPVDLAAAIEQLATDSTLRRSLAVEAIERPLRTWSEYAREITRALDET